MDNMGKPRTFLFFVSLVSFLVTPQAATAQIYESIGIRAQGMSGAFVAVADDATTTWWNPAGLASGGYFKAGTSTPSLNSTVSRSPRAPAPGRSP
jgi:hypothetical protein